MNCLTIDWLQINCAFKSGMCWNSIYYDIQLLPRRTQHFNKVEFIFKRGRLIATAASEPNKKGIPQDTVLIKFENDVLYQELLEWEVREFIGLNNLVFRNITRLDIALDFREFANGYKVERFLKHFSEEKIQRLGIGKFTEAGDAGTTKGNLINEILNDCPPTLTKAELINLLNCKIGKVSKDRFKLTGHIKQQLERDYLRIGLHTSPVSVYVYNKTKELLEVKYKPWIVENWLKNNLITEYQFNEGLNTDFPIWRIETSFKGSRKVLKHITAKGYGKEIGFNSLEIIKTEYIEYLFKLAVIKYFSFVKNDNTINKSRKERIELFDWAKNKFEFVLTDRTRKKESGRAEKIFINKLEKTNQELKGTDDDLAEMAETLRKYMIYSRDTNHLDNKKIT